MEREQPTTYETGGYGQQAMETGTEQPSLTQRAESMITGKTPEETRYGTHEYGSGSGSLADSMRSTLSARPGLGTKYEQQKPTVGEKIKAAFTGTSAEEQHGYEHGRGYEQSRERERGYGTTRGQPSIMERVESTFTGRTPQEQHEYDTRQRRQRDMERERSRGSSEPGFIHELGGMVSGATAGMFGPETGSKKSFKQRWHDSMSEIRHSLTGKPGETSYTPMTRTPYGTEYPTSQRHTGRGY